MRLLLERHTGNSDLPRLDLALCVNADRDDICKALPKFDAQGIKLEGAGRASCVIFIREGGGAAACGVADSALMSSAIDHAIASDVGGDAPSVKHEKRV